MEMSIVVLEVAAREGIDKGARPEGLPGACGTFQEDSLPKLWRVLWR